MKINSITSKELRIPFRDSFSHATAERNETEAILTQVVLDDGTTGYGEGCPRDYVTGETIKSALSFIDSITIEVREKLADLSSLRIWVK